MEGAPSHGLGARRWLASGSAVASREVIFGLRITSRCWRDDLGYSTEEPDLSVALERLIVREFVRTRRVNPDGDEGPIAALRVPWMKLKASRDRAVTVWEARPQGRVGIQDPLLGYPGVVWLAGVGFRKEGDPDDAYEEFARLGPSRLSPISNDYTYLYADIRIAAVEALRDDLERALNELVERAQREPGVFHAADLEIGELGFAAVVFDNLVYRILIMPMVDAQGRGIPSEIHAALIEVAFPDCRLDELEYPEQAILKDLGYSPGPLEYAIACLREKR